MKRHIFITGLTVVLLTTGVVQAEAQVRFDVNISVPYYFGVNLATSFGFSDQSLDTVTKYVFPIPDFQLAYQFGTDVIRGGIGCRAYTLILESLVFPNLFVEWELHPVVLRADVGGGFFLFFGLFNYLAAGQVLLPDLNVAVKLTDWFELGTGVIGFVPLQAQRSFGWAGYISARLSP